MPQRGGDFRSKKVIGRKIRRKHSLVYRFLRAEFWLKSDIGYPKDAGVTLVANWEFPPL